jgi:hypothetical protein
MSGGYREPTVKDLQDFLDIEKKRNSVLEAEVKHLRDVLRQIREIINRGLER